jgi:hypothetical protein
MLVTKRPPNRLIGERELAEKNSAIRPISQYGNGRSGSLIAFSTATSHATGGK